MKTEGPVTFIVARPEQGMALLDLLARRMKISNKAAKRLLDDRVVFVNNRRTWMARHPAETGDRIEVRRAAPHPVRTDLRILREEPPYLVIDKPAGLLSNGPGSAEELLRAATGDRSIEAVHRLDRDTSGCLLFARGRAALDAAIERFEEKSVGKTYQAIVIGSWPPGITEIRKQLEGLSAVTRVRVARAGRGVTLLELHPMTGRTHQIRQHLAGAGHPVLGDKQYATMPVGDPILRGTPRQMLHASGIDFPMPGSEKRLAVRAPLPADFRETMRRTGL